MANTVDFGPGYKAIVSYNGDFSTNNLRIGDSVTLGNDIALYIVTVPMPSVLLTALAGLGLGWRRRRVRDESAC